MKIFGVKNAAVYKAITLIYFDCVSESRLSVFNPILLRKKCFRDVLLAIKIIVIISTYHFQRRPSSEVIFSLSRYKNLDL